MPVVAVEDVREEIRDIPAALAHSLGEKGHALAVVKVAVGRRPVKIELVVHEVPGDAAPLQLEQTAVLAAPAQRHIKRAQEAHLLFVLLADLRQLGQHHADVHVGTLDRPGQSGRHVPQPAGLDEGGRLKGGEKDVQLFVFGHITPPFGRMQGLFGVPQITVSAVTVTDLSQITFSSRAPALMTHLS